MELVLTNKTVSVSELKKNPSSVIKQAETESVAILKHNIPTAYIVSSKIYEKLMNKLEDYEISLLIKEREREKLQAIEVDIDEL